MEAKIICGEGVSGGRYCKNMSRIITCYPSVRVSWLRNLFCWIL